MWRVYNNNNDEGQRINFFFKFAWASGSGELHVKTIVSLGQHSLTCTTALPHSMNQKLTILLTIRNILIDHNFSNLGNTLLFTSSKTVSTCRARWGH